MSQRDGIVTAFFDDDTSHIYPVALFFDVEEAYRWRKTQSRHLSTRVISWREATLTRLSPEEYWGLARQLARPVPTQADA